MSSRQETLLMQIITEFETAGIENIQAIGEAFDSVKDLDFDKQATAITAGLKKALGQESPELDSAMQEYAKKVGGVLSKHLSDIGSGGEKENMKALSAVFKTLGVDGGEVLKVIGPIASGFGNIAGVVGPLLGPLGAIATAFGVITQYGGETIIINEEFRSSWVSIAQEAPGQVEKVQAAITKMSIQSGKDIKEMAALFTMLRSKVEDTGFAKQLAEDTALIAAKSGKDASDVANMMLKLASGISAAKGELLEYGLSPEEIASVSNNAQAQAELIKKKWMEVADTNSQVRNKSLNELKNTLTAETSALAKGIDDIYTWGVDKASKFASNSAEVLGRGFGSVNVATKYIADYVYGTNTAGEALDKLAGKSKETAKELEKVGVSPKVALDELINSTNKLKEGFQNVAEDSFKKFSEAFASKDGINTLKDYTETSKIVAEYFKLADDVIQKFNVDLEILGQKEIKFGVDEATIRERVEIFNKQVAAFTKASDDLYAKGTINAEQYAARNAAATQMVIDNDRKVIASKEQLLNLQTDSLSTFVQLEGDITGLTEEANLERLKLEINSTAARLSLYENFHDERINLERDLTSLVVQEYKTRKDLFFRYASDVIDVQKSINSFQEITSGTNTEKRMQLIDSEIQLEQELMKTVDVGSEQYVTSSNKVLALMAQRKTALVETLEYQKNASLYLIELDNTLDSLGENSTDKRIALTQDKLKAEVDAMEKYINAERLTGRQALEARKELNSKSVELLNSYEDETNQFLQRMLSGQFGAAATELNDVALNNMKAQIEPLVKNAGSMTRKELQSAVAEYFYSGSPILTEMQNLTDEGRQEWQNILADMVRSTTDMQEKYGEVRGDIQKNKAEIEEISAVDSFDSLATEADRTTKAFNDLSSVLENIVGDKMSGAKVALDKSALEMKQAMDNFSKTTQAVGAPTNAQPQRTQSDARLLVDAINKLTTQQKTVVEETVKGVLGAVKYQTEPELTKETTPKQTEIKVDVLEKPKEERKNDKSAEIKGIDTRIAEIDKKLQYTKGESDISNLQKEKAKLESQKSQIENQPQTNKKEYPVNKDLSGVISKLADGIEKMANAVSSSGSKDDKKDKQQTVSLNMTPAMFENIMLELASSLRKEI